MGCHLSIQVKPWSPKSPKNNKKTPITSPLYMKRRKTVGTTRGIVDTSLPTSCPPPSTKVALCVGINTYQHFPPLSCAENDAVKISELFKAANFNVKTILGKHATRSAIVRELQWCVQSGDTFVVALFGHGLELDNSALFIPVDARSGEQEGDKIHTDVLRGLSRRSKASSGLFIFDCCFSGTFLQRATRAPSWVGQLTRERSRIVITSGMSGETVDDDDGSGHSPFASSFITAMKESPPVDVSVIQLFVRIRSECIAKYHGSVIPLLGRFPGDNGGDTFLK